MVRCRFAGRAQIRNSPIMLYMYRAKTPSTVQAAAFTFKVNTDFHSTPCANGASPGSDPGLSMCVLVGGESD